eukprot:558532-Amphidinium_carterae.1
MSREFEEVEEPKDKRITSRAQINQAIDHINLKGQTGVGKNEAMRWAWGEHFDPASPLYRMPISFIREGLANK